MDSTWKAGLEDVIAARSAVCTVDGEAGRGSLRDKLSRRA